MLVHESHHYSQVYRSVKALAEPDVTMLGDALFPIGLPCPLPKEVDPTGRIFNILKSKMSVIDIIPCKHLINVDKILGKDLSGLLPEIDYAEAVEEFINDCTDHGLNGHSGLRLYVTDDTQAADSISNSRGGKNFFQDIADTAYQTLSPISNFLAATGFAESGISKELVSGTGDLLSSIATTATGMFGGSAETSAQIGQLTGTLTEKIADSSINGYKYSFPTIWNDASYKPNLSTRIKLISPYGHPDAIKKYIIEPLMYLLILGSPKTKDGMAFGRPWTVTIMGYGLTNIPMGAISSISMVRGGSNTSYNIYKQPTSIDLSIQFESLVGGFATYTRFDKEQGSTKTKANTSLATDSNKFITDFGKSVAEQSPSLITLDHIVESLKPIPSEPNMEAHVYLGKQLDSNDNLSSFGSNGIGDSHVSTGISLNTLKMSNVKILSDIEMESKKLENHINMTVDDFMNAIKNPKGLSHIQVESPFDVMDDLAKRPEWKGIVNENWRTLSNSAGSSALDVIKAGYEEVVDSSGIIKNIPVNIGEMTKVGNLMDAVDLSDINIEHAYDVSKKVIDNLKFDIDFF